MGVIQAHQNMIFQKANTNVLWVVASHIRLVISGINPRKLALRKTGLNQEKGQFQLPPELLSMFSRQHYFMSLESSGYQSMDL